MSRISKGRVGLFMLGVCVLGVLALGSGLSVRAQKAELILEAMPESPERPATAAEAAKGIVRSRGARVDLEALWRGLDGGKMALNLFDDVTLDVATVKPEKRPDGYRLRGATADGKGILRGGLIGTTLELSLETPEREYLIVPADGVHSVVERRVTRPLQMDDVLYAPPLLEPANPPTLETGAGADTIDVLVVYNAQARDAAGGRAIIEARIAEGVEFANAAYSRSDVIQRVNLVHAQEVDYAETGGNMLADLAAVQRGDVPEVHQLRNRHAADLVTLVIADVSEFCGRGYLMEHNTVAFATWAYSVVAAPCLRDAPAHEWGHNMGLHHDVEDVGVFPYSHGYRDPDGLFHTLMSRGCPAWCPRVDYFSNPRLTIDWGGEPRPLGNADNADSARSLNETRNTVASFRHEREVEDPPYPRRPKFLVDGTVTFDWDAVSFARQYRVIAIETPSRIRRVDTWVDGTSYESSPLEVPPNQTYKWWVLGANGLGEGPASEDVPFTALPQQPSAPSEHPTLYGPSGCTSLQPTLEWSSVDRATYYKVKVAEAWTGNFIYYDDYYEGTRFPMPFVLQPGKPYYWDVKAKNSRGEGPFGTVMYFTAGCPQPPVARPGGPYTGVVDQPIRFDGSASSDPDGTIADYLWRFSDWGFEQRGVVAYHSFDGAGAFTATLTVRDNDGYTHSAAADVIVDGPRTATIGVYRASNGTFYLRNTNTTGGGDIVATYGSSGDTPLVGDWDGDGDDTLGVFRPSTSGFYLRNSNTTGIADVTFALGRGDDVPLVGDWNGDGIDSAGVYRPSTRTFHLRNAHTTGGGDVAVAFGQPKDVPLAGDWDGDGVDTIGVYRPSNGTFYLLNSHNVWPPDYEGDVVARYGSAGDVPIVGDWDGNGTDTLGVYRPSTMSFYLRRSNTTGAADYPPIRYGIAGDRPLAGNWTTP